MKVATMKIEPTARESRESEQVAVGRISQTYLSYRIHSRTLSCAVTSAGGDRKERVVPEHRYSRL